MENDFYNRFKRIIRECSYENTYKMAWAKSIVEICSSYEDTTNDVVISLKEIAKKFLKYYWNQTIYFDLIQGSNPQKPPIILSLTKSFIEKYYLVIKKRQPEVFEKIEDRVQGLGLENFYKKTISDIEKILKKDVSWRFDTIKGDLGCLYQYERKGDYLIINKENSIILKENEQDLYDLINYRWSLILENFNSSPRINKKVRIIDERNIKRASLNNFKEYLDLENPNHYCFICGEQIPDSELAIDHVIPWSYMYSDDLWNLVYTCQSCNSRKSNTIPSKSFVDKLKERNMRLLNLLNDNNASNKVFEELKFAINKDYVYKFWTGCKG